MSLAILLRLEAGTANMICNNFGVGELLYQACSILQLISRFIFMFSSCFAVLICSLLVSLSVVLLTFLSC